MAAVSASGGEIPEERDQDSDAKTQPNKRSQTRRRERVASPGRRCRLCQQSRAREDASAASSERGA
ncbi:uncharacterized protein SCHCODRAFT_02515004 [Schizophyllum commune H4-8]|uniref:uncharacterized protein n=1 Tax=Schizophyllum commune (strain H4-8 / FGSC 9210) TaxID=578458 RepID=UPI0021610BD7|nr:uncharacterized protein SCHCODRAFT_02515004 [Schizophyllum commune H4-8]KAI5887597.1 hypothetical protein SCHCODRAFT_02515004 [Schizophyllum commune H4-8]